jgi:signal transduction histidine kinase
MHTTSDRMSIWKVRYGENIPQRLFGDCKHITQILINLIENAIIHSIDGGKHKVNVYYLEDQQMLDFRVSNVCKKINPNSLLNMFTIFHRASSVSSRTGLGLYHSKRICESYLKEAELSFEKQPA